jgi:hypothetical protein
MRHSLALLYIYYCPDTSRWHIRPKKAPTPDRSLCCGVLEVSSGNVIHRRFIYIYISIIGAHVCQMSDQLSRLTNGITPRSGMNELIGFYSMGKDACSPGAGMWVFGTRDFSSRADFMEVGLAKTSDSHSQFSLYLFHSEVFVTAGYQSSRADTYQSSVYLLVFQPYSMTPRFSEITVNFDHSRFLDKSVCIV